MSKNKKRSVSAGSIDRYPTATFSMADSDGGFAIINALREYCHENDESQSGIVKKLVSSFLKRKGYNL